jgi:hypothetical protein
MQTMQLSNEKCARHSQRYCPEPSCCTSLVTNTNQPAQSPTPGFEDQLVGRTEQPTTLIPKVQAEKPQPAEMPTQAAQAPESQATALVKASQTYAESVAAADKAVAVVADLERRLEFARENAADAIKAKDEAFQRIRNLVGEKS